MSPRELEGKLIVPQGARFGIVASRFNHFVVDRLVDGALDAIRRHGGEKAEITIVRVPGAWEIPYAVKRLSQVKQHREKLAIIALGAVIRGSTPHFDYIAAEVTKGIASASMESGIPTAFGVLTTDTIEQAIERAGTKAGNKGWEAAVSAIELLNLSASLKAHGF